MEQEEEDPKQINPQIPSKPTSQSLIPDVSPPNQEEDCDQPEAVDDTKQINPQSPSKPTSELLIPDDRPRNEEQQDREVECDRATSSSKLGESEAVGDDNDGFRTPTSPDQRIPKLTQCPPAPKKPLTLPPKKRKAPSAAPSQQHCRSIRSRRSVMVLDLTDEEVDSMFPPIIQQDSSPTMIKRSPPTDN